MRKIWFFLIFGASFAFAGDYPNYKDLKKMSRRFVSVNLNVDVSHLSLRDRRALKKLIAASREVNTLYRNQLWEGNRGIYEKLRKDKSAFGKLRFSYFVLNGGPWSELDENAAFIPDVPKRPLGADFYPADMTKPDFEKWMGTLSAVDQDRAKGYFTVIRKDKEGKLSIVPYSEAYEAHLKRIAKWIREAAALTDNASLKKFLKSRADAFFSNLYDESELAWMDLDAPLDVTIGPYETYADGLFGYKAAFEAYVNLKDDEETKRLQFFANHLQEVENNLPIDPQYRNPKIGAMAPIRVVNEIYSAGDAAHGVKSVAYNLPNDEKIAREKGTKRVMLKNLQEAKFNAILIPISKIVLDSESRADVDFTSFFTHIVAHELCHGLGPNQIKVKDRNSVRDTTPRLELKELYGAIEEAKADITGLYMLQYLFDHISMEEAGSVLKAGAANEHKLYVTYLASAFRTLRFGLTEAHGKGMALQLNYLFDKGAFKVNENGTFSVDFTKIKGAVRDLTHELLMIEALGDYAAAKKMLESLSVIKPTVQKAIDRLNSIPVPVDVDPVPVTANRILPQKR